MYNIKVKLHHFYCIIKLCESMKKMLSAAGSNTACL